MSVGNGQRYEIRMNDQPSFKMYHFATGGSVDKPIWSDAAKTTPLAQPAVADANGNLTFFADGIYRMVFKDSTDVSITGMDYDDFKITADMATVFEANQGTVLPSATAAKTGHHFLLFDVSSNILGIYYCDGTQYKATAVFNAAGLQQFDSVITKTMPQYNVLHADWGATGGGSIDDTNAINLALAAVPATGAEVLFPTGTYLVDLGSLLATGKYLRLKGDGSGKSIIKTTVNTITNGVIDFNPSNIAQRLEIEGLDIVTSHASSPVAINCNWPTTSGITDLSNLLIKDCYIGAATTHKATAQFLIDVDLTDAKKPVLDNVFMRGKDTINPGASSKQSLVLNGYTQFLDMTKCKMHYTADAISATTNVSNLSIIDNDFLTIKRMLVTSGTTGTDYTIALNRAKDVYLGGIINNAAMKQMVISNNTIEQSASATATWLGINVIADSFTISQNTIIDSGGSGTSTGISINTGSTNGTVSANNTEDLTNGIVLQATTSGVAVTGNHDNGSSIPFASSSTGNYFANNYPSSFIIVPSAAALGTGLTGTPVYDTWNVTGTTGITSIHADVDPRIDREITLIFAAVLTVTDGGNLNLAGNFTTTAGDVLVLKYDGTNWNETTRSVN